jgi:hypothetical protein
MSRMSGGTWLSAGRGVGYRANYERANRNWGSAGAISGPPQLKGLKQ